MGPVRSSVQVVLKREHCGSSGLCLKPNQMEAFLAMGDSPGKKDAEGIGWILVQLPYFFK